ncbi:cupin domain-containing protein [Duganella violaceipulchra]|uniref:Cupin domain-containing protein n=1 Tax=Duganella violaceipulchra TaxID=2849652 RepID=A0AA41L6U6_9BURK|nr:cupin domain-containing protein [Duganella violaceicalia]MBV6325644.1 cupin domain-containing protein [Duganella violaceicalia]MCP2012781.1 quercetin dioxygenase-like cupin family protein [Duganella violaceicalia]
MKTTGIYRLAAALMVSVGLVGTVQAHDVPRDGKEVRAILQTKQLPDVAHTKGLMLTVTYAPGQKSIPHLHPGSVFAYVVAGEVTSKLDDGAEITYKVGDSWYESPGMRHVVSRNASDTNPAKLLVVLLLPDGAQVSEPIPK